MAAPADVAATAITALVASAATAIATRLTGILPDISVSVRVARRVEQRRGDCPLQGQLKTERSAPL